MVQTAKQEALIGVDLYNRASRDRSLEGFVVHMSIAWLYLCHAILMRDGIDYRHWTIGPKRRLIREDGEPKTWELRRCVRELFPNDNDPVRRNIEFFIPLRNMIEHRHARLLEPVVAGRAQSLILNFEDRLIADFGAAEGLGDSLRLPIFLSSLTGDAQAAVKRAYKLLPARLTNFISSYDASLPSEIRDHPNYEFRVYLLPHLGPKTEADAAIRFIKLEDYGALERDQIEHGLVIIRNKDQGGALGTFLRAGEVADSVAATIPWSFNVHAHHTPAWRYFNIRPMEGKGDPAKTDIRFCIYVRAVKQYLYTDAWVARLSTELRTEEGFRNVTGREPRRRTDAPTAPSADSV